MWDVFMGAVMIAVAAVLFLYRRGTLPRNPSDPDAMERWRSQWATPLKWTPPLLLILGLLRVVSALL